MQADPLLCGAPFGLRPHHISAFGLLPSCSLQADHKLADLGRMAFQSNPMSDHPVPHPGRLFCPPGFWQADLDVLLPAPATA